MNGTQRNYKASKVKMFLFFLLLALIFWFLTKFSNESTATVNGYLSYTNLPEAVMVGKDNLSEVSFDVSATGFQFLSYKLNEPTIDIDISSRYSQGDSLVTITNSELIKIISEQLDNNTLVRNTSLAELNISLDVLSQKKVNVALVNEMSFKEGFRLLGPVTITPDSVVVSGPSSALESLENVITTTFNAKNVASNVDEQLLLLLPDELQTSTKEVRITATVEEFSQKKLAIPIEVINLPEEVNIKLIPNEVTLSFDAAMSRFNLITASDFRLICDYSIISEGENFMVPRLTDEPNGIYHVEIDPKRVEYLIFK